jgi:UDP-GlcNAc:undecaprenyl-phosphate GlcNAc-1-phosphate transferase
VVAFLISFIFSAIFVYLIYKKCYGIDKCSEEKSHAMHDHEVSRLGGLGVIGGILISSIFFSPSFMTILIAGTAIFVFGFLEDRFHLDLPYSKKIGFMILSTITLLYMTKEGAFNGGFILLDRNSVLEAGLGYFIALIGIVGFASAVNFIDGLNGYAMGVIFITLSFFGIHFYEAGMSDFLNLILILNGAILGFLIFNFPFGKIFLGDMGAHLFGFMVGFISIAMTNYETDISLWYPLAAFTIPIVNTIQKIPRRIKRKKLYGIPFGESDSEDLHYFMFQYIKKKYPNIKNGALKNSVAALYILVPHLILNIVAFYFRHNDIALALIFVLATLVYLWVYKRLESKS